MILVSIDLLIAVYSSLFGQNFVLYLSSYFQPISTTQQEINLKGLSPKDSERLYNSQLPNLQVDDEVELEPVDEVCFSAALCIIPLSFKFVLKYSCILVGDLMFVFLNTKGFCSKVLWASESDYSSCLQT